MSGSAFGQLYTGETASNPHERQRNGSADNMAATSSKGAAIGVRPGEWTEKHVPAAATQATCTKTAPTSGKRLVITGVSATIATSSTAQTPILIELLFGSTQKLAWKCAAPANSMGGIAISGLCIPAGAEEAVTLRFGGAGVTDSEQAVALSGFVAE